MKTHNWRKKGLKFSITGPESAGKSTLATILGKHFELPVVPEYARKYFENKAVNNREETILHIAKEQIRLEEDYLASGKSICCDTDLITLKIWLKYYNYPIPSFIENHFLQSAYDFSILLYPNTEWVDDGIRSNPNDRLALFKQFEEELNTYDIPYHIVKEIGSERSEHAKRVIAQFVAKV